jgi:hypothetical protein
MDLRIAVMVAGPEERYAVYKTAWDSEVQVECGSRLGQRPGLGGGAAQWSLSDGVQIGPREDAQSKVPGVRRGGAIDEVESWDGGRVTSTKGWLERDCCTLSRAK